MLKNGIQYQEKYPFLGFTTSSELLWHSNYTNIELSLLRLLWKSLVYAYPYSLFGQITLSVAWLKTSDSSLAPPPNEPQTMPPLLPPLSHVSSLPPSLPRPSCLLSTCCSSLLQHWVCLGSSLLLIPLGCSRVLFCGFGPFDAAKSQHTRTHTHTRAAYTPPLQANDSND